MEYLKETNQINIDTKFIDLLKEEDLKTEDKVIDMREDYTYGVEISVEDETKIIDLTKNCAEMIDVAKEIVYK